MTRPVMIAAVALLTLVLAIPLLARLTGGNNVDDFLPSAAELPPLWDGESLFGTMWEADMRTAPTRRRRSDGLFHYRFLPEHRVVLDIIDAEEAKPDVAGSDEAFRQHLRDALFPRFEGVYSVDGSQINLEVTMHGKPVKDVIEIRGENLYYHAVEMTRLEDEQ